MEAFWIVYVFVCIFHLSWKFIQRLEIVKDYFDLLWKYALFFKVDFVSEFVVWSVLLMKPDIQKKSCLQKIGSDLPSTWSIITVTIKLGFRSNSHLKNYILIRSPPISLTPDVKLLSFFNTPLLLSRLNH